MRAGHDPDPDLRRLAAAGRHPVADLVGHVLHPCVVIPALALWTCLRSSPSIASGLGWWVAVMAACVALPWGGLLLLVRAGRVLDTAAVIRRQRLLPMGLAAVIIAIAAVALHAARAPHGVVGFVVGVLVALVIASVFTLAIKVSLHTGSVTWAGTTAALATGSWPVAALTLAAASLVAWARLRAGRHSLAQVLTGAVFGVLVAALTSLLW